MALNIINELKEIEALIQSARGAEAQARLLDLHKKRISKEHACEIAMLARRVGIPELGVRLLYPIVRPEGKRLREASNEDRVEYAAGLIRMEALNEAEEILKAIPKGKVQDAPFFQAIICLKRWDYAEASRFLRTFLEQKGLTPYQIAVGKLNLGMALAYENHLTEAKSILAEVLEDSSAKRFDLLHANALRYLGNLELNRQNLDVGLSYFEQSSKLLQNSPGLDQYFSRKWCALAKYLIDPKSESILEELENVREEAVKRSHWESVRDIDLHVAQAKNDQALFTHLYFGTANPKYRDKVMQKWSPVSVPDKYAWELGKNPIAEIDIAQEQPSPNGGVLKSGQAMHKLYKVLLSDFYRPFFILELFEKIFTGEYYSPGVSEFRVHQTIKRLRQWFEKNAIPLTIVHEEKAYRLAPVKACSIIVHSDREIKSSVDYRLQLIREKIGDEFSVKEIVPLIKVTRRRAVEIVRTAVETGILTSSGAKSKTRYRFKKAS